MPEDLLARLRELVFTEVGELVADMMPTLRLDAAMIYTRYFSLEELKELRLLQEHSVMRKGEKVAPQMMADLSKIGMEAAIARQPAMEEKIEALIEERLAKEGVATRAPPPETFPFRRGSSPRGQGAATESLFSALFRAADFRGGLYA